MFVVQSLLACPHTTPPACPAGRNLVWRSNSHKPLHKWPAVWLSETIVPSCANPCTRILSFFYPSGVAPSLAAHLPVVVSHNAPFHSTSTQFEIKIKRRWRELCQGCLAPEPVSGTEVQLHNSVVPAAGGQKSWSRNIREKERETERDFRHTSVLSDHFENFFFSFFQLFYLICCATAFVCCCVSNI